MPTAEPRPPEAVRPLATLFAGLVGVLLAILPVKYGNPVIFEGFWDAGADVWPISRAYLLLSAILVLALLVGRPCWPHPRWILLAPVAWLGWQFISATQTVDRHLTGGTLWHFAASVSCFYVGWFALSRLRSLNVVWIALLFGFSVVIWTGWNQRFGGLEDTRQWFNKLYRGESAAELQPRLDPRQRTMLAELLSSPTFQQKLLSNRIFSTFVYPNALACAILLYLPMLLASVWRMSTGLSPPVRTLLLLGVGIPALACLWWSGSKSGWLVLLLVIGVLGSHLPFHRRLKMAVLAVVLIVGGSAFALKYSDYFQRGATSLGARMDYWKAAVQVAGEKPLFGTGPGTFSIPYRRLKAEKSEMTRLVHNDYLQQASDSGLIGFVAYFAAVPLSLFLLYRKRIIGHGLDLEEFAVWIGLLGWSVHSAVEFPIYIPALAWTPFLFLGWLWGRAAGSNQVDMPEGPG